MVFVAYDTKIGTIDVHGVTPNSNFAIFFLRPSEDSGLFLESGKSCSDQELFSLLLTTAKIGPLQTEIDARYSFSSIPSFIIRFYFVRHGASLICLKKEVSSRRVPFQELVVDVCCKILLTPKISGMIAKNSTGFMILLLLQIFLKYRSVFPDIFVLFSAKSAIITLRLTCSLLVNQSLLQNQKMIVHA